MRTLCKDSSQELGRAPTSEQLQRQRFRLCVPKWVEDRKAFAGCTLKTVVSSPDTKAYS